MNDSRNIDREIDDLELVSDRDERRLYELNVFEAIKRVSLKTYSKDELFHTSHSVSAEIANDIADIRRKTSWTESKIYRGSVALGSSLIQRSYDKKSKVIDELAGKISRMDVPYIRREASQENRGTIIHSTNHPMKKNNRFVRWSVIYLDMFGQRTFIVLRDMIRISLCFSLNTWDDAINRDVYEKEIESFEDYINNKLFVFEAICEKYERDNIKEKCEPMGS